jgi:hypothetical protein
MDGLVASRSTKSTRALKAARVHVTEDFCSVATGTAANGMRSNATVHMRLYAAKRG